MRVRDISAQVVTLPYGGLPYELDDGRLAVARLFGAPNYEARIIVASAPYDELASAANGTDIGVAQGGRYFYRAANGYLYFGTARSDFFGKIVRSTDAGATWAVVHQSTAGDAIWHITENSAGDLFANTYGQPSNLGVRAHDVYKSTDNGATWSTWLQVPDSILHIHGIYCDSADNMFIGCGEWYTNRVTGCTATWAAGVATITCPSAHKAIAGGVATHSVFSVDGYNGTRLTIASVIDEFNYTVAMPSDPGGAATGGRVEPQFYNGAIRRVTDNGATGTIGDVISYRGNGWIHMVEADNGNLVFGWDTSGSEIPIMPSGASNLFSSVRGHYEIGAEMGGFCFDGCKGRDGVIYLLMVQDTPTSCVYASADDGVTWQVLDLGLGESYHAVNITCNPNGPSRRVYIAGGAGNQIKTFPDFTRAELNGRITA